jgi:hypothetical protein
VVLEEQQLEGALVVDTERDKLGYVMGRLGRVVRLRPVTGGREWDVDPAHVRRTTDEERQQAMRERTRALNSASSGGLASLRSGPANTPESDAPHERSRS